ncbi:MAG: Gfo/Idh/MocA family oxidoreductase [Chloroflexi bacterium]|nr:Gfo/Idh/MocA family oxidoreductase [Chloroflexota bacterium]MCI0775446.1 Gfo/Idh/MocA family oxidoreductase [Chloroflexota bacterium]MCI0803827.1 Gfo/Idh/MocA family oxidoreductase [Chloroflexota bacterium]
MAGPLRIGLVGVGQRGLQHVNSLVQLQQEEIVQITALADPFPENLDENKITGYVPDYSPAGVKLFDSADAMIESGLVDAIWFVIPPNQHRGEIERAAKREIAIYAEKPQSLFLDDIVSQDIAITKAGVPSTVGFQMRHDRGYTDIANYLKGKWVAAMTMVAEGGVENHGVKHSHTEEQGGPANRVWTANRAWSGTSIVEAGIHQTDIMRYWSDDDVEWVRATYTERPPELHDTEGDNPIAYTVTYGMKKGGVANLLFTKPARSYYNGRFDYIIWTHGTIKLEDDFVDYSFDEDWPPDEKPTIGEVRKVISAGPHNTAMGGESTRAISEAFATSIVENRPENRLNSFHSSINSLASVLAANISNDLDGEKIVIDEFINDDKYARYRKNPNR